ncbi:Ig-like domain-containing protein [Yersinia aldovae]|uniref:Ig-like domain-containing protein n=1 Tax=Yersinia aldovae TaxID=29483 RepID=UPI001C9411FC|nr:Ig-like domain-containing protein [Yersinia aldovae]
MNIITQFAFPLAGAFTPMMAGAGSDRHFLENTEGRVAMPTKVYTLSSGETTESVAKKHNILLSTLRQLNQLRIFSHGFDHLQPGDELDVPYAPLPTITWDEHNNGAAASATLSDDVKAQKLAGMASQAGAFLSQSPSVDAAASMARGMAVGAAGSEIQQWLSRFGTARVQLDVNKDFSLKNSQFDLLVPLYEQKDSFVFTQVSLHRTDDRTQSNLGMGYRWFTDSWMLGGNTFLDYDLSRGHARMGLGLESWRDFLKLGVNGYQRLTNWNNSPDVIDYEERPANGWDIRAQAWLPVLPQLGGKLTYEQYYGQEVGLFGNDNRQRDPHAITAGITYTPVPLVTLSAEQRQGKSSENDTRFGVDINYQLGVPWQQQINPDAVAAMRSLAGSRYDLVERNNNIVLEYRKKEVIRLKTADLVAGYAGEQKSLGVSVTSKYGLERIDWSASALIAAGGKILQNGSGWTVVMPAYRSGAGSVNSYIVSGVAVDKKGNASSRADTQVTVTQAAIDTSTSLISPSTAVLPADGNSQQEFVLKVNDKEGRPVDITEKEISIDKTSKLRGSSRATLSAFTRRAAGEYVMKVTAGTMQEAFTLTPSARNMHFVSANVTLTADNATSLVDALDVVENNAIADGQSQNRFRVTVVDAQNNPVPSQSISLKADNGAAVAGSAVTESDGTVIVPVSSQHTGETTVTASINDKGSKTLKLYFRPDQNTARIEQKNLSVLPEISLADGKTQKTVTALVTDVTGNAVPDMLVTFSADNAAVIAEKTVKTDIQGMVTTTLTSTVAGISHVAASVNNQSATKNTTFTGNNATAIVTSVNTTAASGIADGATAVTFKAQVKDQNGNPLAGIPVDWNTNKDSSIVSFKHSQTLTSEQGIAEAEVTSTRAYSDVVVTVSTNAASKSASPFTFIADKHSPVIKTLSSNKQMLTANGTDTVALMVNVTDTHGNPLSGVEVILSNSNNAEITPTRPVTDSDGIASASLITRYAGQVTVSAALGEGVEKSLSLQALSDEQTANVTVIPDKSSVTAGQAQPVTLTATVLDGNNNPVSATSVAWQTNHNQLSDTVSQTNTKGQATVKLTGTQATLTTVTAVLYNGNKGSARVTFGPGEPTGEHSQLSVSPQSITADGKSEALTSLILRDQWDNPVPGKVVEWRADKNAGIHFTPTEKGDGLYQASVTGTFEGVWSLSAQSGTVDLQTPLALLASQDSTQIDRVAVSGSDTAKADGQETVTIRAQVKDKNGNIQLKGVAVGWDTSLGTLSSRLSSTDENGVAEITLSSRAAGTAWVSAMLGGSALVKADKQVNFTAGGISAEKSSISISPTSIVAGKESAKLSVTARDTEGNLLTGLKDKINASFALDLKMNVSAFSEVSPGIYEATVSGKQAGTTQVSADVSNIRINHTASLTLNADNDSAIVKGSISATPTSATVGDSVTYTAVITDANENALGAGIPVTWSANEGSTLSSPMTRTDDSGTARVTLIRQLVGTAKVELILPSGTTAAPNVIFSAGDVDESRSELTLAPSVIVAGKETATLTLTLRDSNGNLLTGKSVSGHSDSNNVNVGESQENSNAPGHYTMTVTSDKAGSATLSVKVGGNALNKSGILTVKGDTDSWKLSTVTPDKTRLTAGDAEGVTYSVTVTDAKGNPLGNVVVSWQLRGQAESYEPTSRTNEKGVATTTVKSHTAGQLQMTAYLDVNNHIQADNVTVVAGDIKNATFGADKTSIGSDGKDTVKLTASLKDSYGNPVTGKIVIIKGADSLTGFKLSQVQDQQNGNYVATGTATAQGQVTLNAQVDGKNVGNSVTITVGAITPDLRFDNAQQEVTWTKNFAASQSVQGMPEGLKQIWTSTDETVVTVSDTGKVVLNSSGEAKINVYTPGNAQYNPAMATYTLKVNKAQPQLIFGSGENYTIYGSKFVLPAVKSANDQIEVSDLTINYISSAPEVSDINGSGTITTKKAGSVKFYARTAENNIFKASEAEYILVITKAKLPVSFNETLKKVNVQQMNANSKVYLQYPIQAFPKDAIVEIYSSDSSILKVDTDGSAKQYSPGTVGIKIAVKEDERYEASAASYNLNIYGRPVMSFANIKGASLGQQSDVVKQDWQPYLVSDALQIDWRSDVDPYYLPEKVIVTVSNGNVILKSKEYKKGETSSGQTVIEAEAPWVGKSLTVSLTGYGFSDIESEKVSSIVQTSVVDINQVIGSATGTLKHSVYITSDNSLSASNICRVDYTRGQRDVYLDYNVNIMPKYSEGVSLFMHSITVKIDNNTFTNAFEQEIWTRTMANIEAESVRFKGSDNGPHQNLKLANDCWGPHLGGYYDSGEVSVIVDIEYAGKKFTLASSKMTWDSSTPVSIQKDINLTVK